MSPSYNNNSNYHSFVYNYSDFDQFGIRSTLERCIWVTWYTFIFLLSLIGDSTILLASVKYNTFELPEMVVRSIKNIAVCDLLLALSYVFPCIISLIGNGWVMGPLLCYLNLYLCYYGITVSCLLVATMTTTKYFLLKFPLRSGIWFERHGGKLCAGVWMFALYTPLVFLIVDKDDVMFDYRTYNCMYGFSAPAWKYLKPFLAILGGVLPNMVMIITSLSLLVRAKKRCRGEVRLQGVLTVLLTALVYSLANAPFTIYHVIARFISKTSAQPSFFHRYFLRIAWAIVCCNIVSNFFVYSLSVQSFRKFWKVRIGNLMTNITGKTRSSLKSRYSESTVQFLA